MEKKQLYKLGSFDFPENNIYSKNDGGDLFWYTRS